MSDAIILQQPVQTAQQLLILHHGAGASAQQMVPLGQRLAEQFPNAFIVSVHAPSTSDTHPGGAQWFSEQGLTDDNHAERVAAVVPTFIQNLRFWQQSSGVEPSATAVLGFGQGATLALEAAQVHTGLAGRIVALSGRYAQLPNHAPDKTTLHFVHGKSDPVVHYGHCVTAAQRLVALRGDLTADVIPYLGHEITIEVMDLVVERFVGHIPKHHWDAVLQAAAQQAAATPKP